MALNSNRGLLAQPMPSVVLLIGYLLAFCLLTGSIAYWVMQILAPTAPAAASGVLAEKTSSLDLSGASLLFGTVSTQKPGAPPAPVISSNIQILGLIASTGKTSSAILSVDSKPGQAFAVGDLITSDTRLVEVKRASIVVEKGGERSNIVAPVRPDFASLQAKNPNQGITGSPSTAGATAATQSSSILRPIGAASGIGVSPISPIQPIVPPAFTPSTSPGNSNTPPPIIQPIAPAQGNSPAGGSFNPVGPSPQPQSSLIKDRFQATPKG